MLIVGSVVNHFDHLVILWLVYNQNNYMYKAHAFMTKMVLCDDPPSRVNLCLVTFPKNESNAINCIGNE